LLKFRGYLGFTADNYDEQHVNDIDINSILVYNRDPDSYKGDYKERNYDMQSVKGITAQDLLHKYKKLNQDILDNPASEGGVLNESMLVFIFRNAKSI
jgi:hypothetical protein